MTVSISEIEVKLKDIFVKRRKGSIRRKCHNVGKARMRRLFGCPIIFSDTHIIPARIVYCSEQLFAYVGGKKCKPYDEAVVRLYMQSPGVSFAIARPNDLN